ncbi:MULTISPECIES: VOC family protein [Brevibacterium]|mgnify:CR=1 FL=1|uniref:VOC family protein n=1 Tax=Brevibacterium casei TaxID=33889 RepID=A0A7T3ZWR7_9MICO|nr:VOC family protein [Brevibacterium casei]QQB13082.1 VOC family protein [Brevibacterium casei]
MTAQGSISEIGYVSLLTRDLHASISNAVDVFGLVETESTAKKAFLTAQNKHHELVYTQSDQDAVDHQGLVVENSAELEAIRAKVDRGGYTIVSEQPIEDHIEEGFAFVGPEGFTWQIYTEKLDYSMLKRGTTAPDRLGHTNIQVLDAPAQTEFFKDVFNFAVSDQIGNEHFFLRCNNDHHGVAIFTSNKTGIHHHAWQAGNVYDLVRLGDRLARRGARLAWGPVRHGAGDNVAVYYVEPTGAVIEYYCDMETIRDKDRPARHWDPDDLYWINQWDGQVPADILDHGIPNRQR